eukprot:TRINITY_DN1889_c0_g1_i3.p1 TRINITY_DN1889_c0_g1~~TRINITY_DN1889_c0_g1_i3.p1  ORF type:complete len:279 (+),score=77.00 TRINITY_DN1889_c0_g1_i3:84-839(+)
MVAVKLLLLIAPFALAIERDVALVQLQAEKFVNDEAEENPAEVLSRAKDAMKAAGNNIVSGVRHALGGDTHEEHQKAAASKTAANASQKHAVTPKANASKAHAAASKGNVSQKQTHVVAPKVNASKKEVVAPKAPNAKKQTPVAKQTVSFYLNDPNTEFGDRILVVGDDDTFGNWEPTNGVDLSTNEDTFPEWSLEKVSVEFPTDTVEYKFVVLKPNGTVEWEEFGVQANRKLKKSAAAIQVVKASFGKLA